MIYGNLRSSFSPTGKEYVTHWNPLVSALLGNQSQSPLSGSPFSSSPRSGEFGSGQSSGAGSGGPDDTTRDSERGPNGAAPTGVAAGSGASFGSPFGGMSHGKAGGMIGAGLGLGFGVPGAGLVGNAIGTAMDVRGANQALDTARANNPQMSAPQLGLGAFLSGMLNNASFGLAGTPVGDSMVESAITGISQPGVPGNAAMDPDSFTSAQASSFANDGLAGYGEGAFGDSAGAGSAGPGGETSEAGSSSSSVGDGGASAGGFYSRGGKVNAAHLMGPNPPGPDDGFGGLDHGEFVLRASAAERLGPQILNKLNSGDFKREALVRALMGK